MVAEANFLIYNTETDGRKGMNDFDREREKLLQYACEMEKRVRELEEDNYRLMTEVENLRRERIEQAIRFLEGSATHGSG
jgi:hypothetical protein